MSIILLAAFAFLLTVFVFRRFSLPQGISDVMIASYINPNYIKKKGLFIKTIGSIVSLLGGLPVGSDLD